MQSESLSGRLEESSSGKEKLVKHTSSIDYWFPFVALLKRDPNRSLYKSRIARAFTIWKYKLPLDIKCTELEKQMKERVLTISTLRDNYLRDVVAVKYHLEQIVEAASVVKDSIEMSQAEKDKVYATIEEHAAELPILPNSNLQSLIDHAKKSSNPTSMFLKETLTKAGFISEANGKDLNPWNRSTQFNKQQDYLRPGSHDPDVGGSSFRLANPSSHEMYVSHCKKCVGVLTMVYTWNTSGIKYTYLLIIISYFCGLQEYTYTVETALVHKDMGESMNSEIKVFCPRLINCSIINFVFG